MDSFGGLIKMLASLGVIWLLVMLCMALILSAWNHFLGDGLIIAPFVVAGRSEPYNKESLAALLQGRLVHLDQRMRALQKVARSGGTLRDLSEFAPTESPGSLNVNVNGVDVTGILSQASAWMKKGRTLTLTMSFKGDGKPSTVSGSLAPMKVGDQALWLDVSSCATAEEALTLTAFAMLQRRWFSDSAMGKVPPQAFKDLYSVLLKLPGSYSETSEDRLVDMLPAISPILMAPTVSTTQQEQDNALLKQIRDLAARNGRADVALLFVDPTPPPDDAPDAERVEKLRLLETLVEQARAEAHADFHQGLSSALQTISAVSGIQWLSHQLVLRSEHLVVDETLCDPLLQTRPTKEGHRLLTVAFAPGTRYQKDMLAYHVADCYLSVQDGHVRREFPLKEPSLDARAFRTSTIHALSCRVKQVTNAASHGAEKPANGIADATAWAYAPRYKDSYNWILGYHDRPMPLTAGGRLWSNSYFRRVRAFQRPLLGEKTIGHSDGAYYSMADPANHTNYMQGLTLYSAPPREGFIDSPEHARAMAGIPSRAYAMLASDPRVADKVLYLWIYHYFQMRGDETMPQIALQMSADAKHVFDDEELAARIVSSWRAVGVPAMNVLPTKGSPQPEEQTSPQSSFKLTFFGKSYNSSGFRVGSGRAAKFMISEYLPEGQDASNLTSVVTLRREPATSLKSEVMALQWALRRRGPESAAVVNWASDGRACTIGFKVRSGEGWEYNVWVLESVTREGTDNAEAEVRIAQLALRCPAEPVPDDERLAEYADQLRNILRRQEHLELGILFPPGHLQDEHSDSGTLVAYSDRGGARTHAMKKVFG